MTCMCDFCFTGQHSGVKSSPKILDQINTPPPRVPYNGNMLYEVTTVPTHQTNVSPQQILQSKDYSRPLHVDCSVEYELPSQVKPPPSSDGKSDPLLMIHPCYFRKIEAQRRSPFINNLPAGRVLPTVASSCRQTPPSHNMSATIPSQQRNIPSTLIHRSGNTSGHTSTMSNNQIQYPSNHFPNSQCQWPEQIQQIHPQSRHHSYKTPLSVGKRSSGAALHATSASSCAAPGLYGTGLDAGASVSGLWSNTSNHSPLAAERFPDPLISVVNHPNNTNKHNNILTSKYRQYIRTQRLHPYMCVSSSAFPQMQQIPCYNV